MDDHQLVGARAAVAIGAVLLALGGPASIARVEAQQPAAAARAGVLRRQIERAPAVRVDPRILATRPEPTAPPPAPAPTVAPAAPPVAAPAESPPAPPEPTPAVPAPESAAIPPPGLTRGELYYVPLDAQLEAESKALVLERIASIQPTSSTNPQTFEGVVRQVAANDLELQLKPFVLVGRPLTYNKATRTFQGSVVVGVADVTGATTQVRLSAPLRFEDVASAQQVTLEELSPPFGRFDVSTQATGQPVTMRIASNFSREGVEITVPVSPTLFVEVDNDRLRGLGMQHTRVTVRAVGPAISKVEVSLAAPGAFLSQDRVQLDSQGLGHAELRSDNSGTVTLRATATGYVAADLPISVEWPWQTLASTCLGGLIGGFLRLAPGIRRGMKGSRFAVGLAVSTLMGLVIFALHVLGVKLLPVDFGFQGGDLFAFASGALAGWLGTALLPAQPATRAA